ncbi:membrane protein required for colicin V production [Novosphingobium kunmingense]|uniref:Membrane protein required for colicin V production n=1 Tax=Novosphingobium kunmingense TaxID=1211806 RepID=A0A2N0I2P6_9SPHN|nr:CvpA family protein [Novosphingobium kunmingense]PKB25457.1 membrane protein required for colicin V production [Novosphingobium kunmingense]
MTGFDIAVLLLVGLGAITGFMRGFVQEVLTLAAWVLSVFAIHEMHTPLTEWLVPRVGTDSGAAVLAFALLLLIPYAIVKLLAARLGAASRESSLGPIDRVLGFGFGTMKGVLIAVMAFSVLVLGYDTVWGANGRPDWISQSRSYPFIDAASREMVEILAQRRQEALDADAKNQAAKKAAKKRQQD